MIILLVLLASIAASFALASVLVRRSRAQAAEALAPLGTATRVTAATALGSTDAVGVRGTGTLLLTDTDLGFAQWRPLRLLRLPRAEITSVGTTRSFLGRTMKSDVLHVTWRSEGTREEAAFFVRDLEPWLADLGGSVAEET